MDDVSRLFQDFTVAGIGAATSFLAAAMQQLPMFRLENRDPVPTGQLLCSGHNRGSLPHRPLSLATDYTFRVNFVTLVGDSLLYCSV